MAIWVIKDGQREGPYEEQDVRELLYEGTYTDSDAAIRDGQFDWATLGDLLAGEEVLGEDLGAEPPPLPAIHQEEFTPFPAADSIPQEPSGPAESPRPIQVAVIDFQMPFGSMVVLMVKWVLASIPALLILGAIAAVFWLAFFALIAAAVRH